MTNELTIEKQIPKYLKIEVIDQDTLNEASTYLIGAKKEYKLIKADMDKLLDPIKESIDLIKEKYDPRLKALKSLIEGLTLKTTTYQTEAHNALLQAQQKIADRIGDGKGHLKVETASKQLENLGTIEKSVETNVGAMSFVPHPMCEVEDITKVPMKYHVVDMVSVRAEMKAGNKIEGIRYWVEQRPRNTR